MSGEISFYKSWLLSQKSKSDDSQSPSLSWCQAPIWGPNPDFYHCQTFAGLLTWGPLWWEDESAIYSYCWLSPAQSFSGSSPAGLIIIFYWLRFECQVIVFTYPRNTVARFYPQALGSLFVASCVSLDYGGCIRNSLHRGMTSPFNNLSIKPQNKTALGTILHSPRDFCF
jgi:hypothetical protein